MHTCKNLSAPGFPHWNQTGFACKNLSAPGFPHWNQTGFVKKTSCTDAIFSSYKILSRLARGGDTFFDLKKAFGTVQYPLLLKCVFDCGINDKAWRILNSWYTKPKCKIQVNGMLSSTITESYRASPTLFLLVIDPLLRKLERRSVGPCLRKLYCGAFAHADDIQTISTSRDTLHEQISIVESFTKINVLVLNAQKCEVVVVSSKKPADVAVSGRAIFEACVEPVLLYNCENWFLTEPLLAKLDRVISS